MSYTKRPFGKRFIVILLTIALLVVNLPQIAIAGGSNWSQFANEASNEQWIYGDLNGGNSLYVEGMSVPQRLILDAVDGTAGINHYVDFQYQYTKGGKYAYDFITSWNQAKRAAKLFANQTWTDDWMWLGVNASLKGELDNYYTDVAIGNNGLADSKAAAYEGAFGYGARTLRIYSDQALGNATITMNNTLNGSIASDSKLGFTVRWTGPATKVMILYSSHVAVGDGSGSGIDWGSAMGAGNINGSPYHNLLGPTSSEWSGSQSMDNQMSGGAPEIISKTVTKVWNYNGNLVSSRPTSVSVQLKADGVAYGSPVQLTATGNWTYTWAGLPKYSGKKLIVYTVEEVAVPDHYTVSYSADTFTITNTYAARGSVTLAATKSLTGRTLAAGAFSFQLKQGATVLQTKTNAANGSITFDPINYTQADIGKTFTYTITEANTGALGYTYDNLVMTVTVNVTDNGNGTLTATPTYPADTIFNNSYLAGGSVTLAATKSLTGRALAAGEFSFQLKEGATVLQTKTNAANGAITFDPINYTQADIGKTFTYTINEVGGALGGVTYDSMVMTVTVNVTDNGNGTLTATPTYPADTIFNNSYTAGGSVTLAATKSLTGRALAAGEFSFELKEGATLLQTKTNAADGSVAFDAISYSLANVGLHTYTIKEVVGTLGGITYDPMTLTVTVNVTDNGNGTLTATPAYPADTIFNNSYTASGRVALAATKSLTGRALAAGEFSFELKEGATLLQTKTNALSGAIAFDAISYSLADVGLHTYTIKEVVGTLGGVTYDPMTLTVTVNVTDNGSGTLTATPAYPADTTFNNSYVAGGSVTLAATKSLTGRALAAGEFSFELKEGATLLQTKTNAADGSVAFDAINYTLANVGLHTYTIKEVVGTLGGVTYDPMTLTVTVNVTDNGNGSLTATPAYPADTIFNNSYAASGSVALAATKSLTGRALAAGEFSFDLKEGATLLQTKTNALSGAIAFDAISYSLADVGLHTYTIKEVVGTLGGVTYDPMTLTVTVNVTDNGNGTLTATPAYPADIIFNNSYTASGRVALAATKSLTGRALAAGEFSFELSELVPGPQFLFIALPGSTNHLQTKTNALDGSITFDAIDYTLADVGLHTYTIKEVVGTLGGVTYDPMMITVTVNVSDNGDGTLTATPTYPADTTFDNSYAGSGNVALAATKVLTGRALAADEFSFQLKEGATLLQTKTNAADGSVAFDAISYTLADVGAHTYTIAEIAGSEANMHYDPLTITVTVTVTDNGDGTLTATPSYPNDVTFNNEYLTPAIDIVKTVANQTAGDPQSKFASLQEGETAEYQLVVTNTGNTALSNVTVEDDQVAIGTVVTLSTGGTATFADLGGTYPAINLGTLQPDESVTLTYTYLTRFADIAKSPIVNTASVEGTMLPTRAYPEGLTLNDSDDAAIEVASIPLVDIGLDIIKMVRNTSTNGILAKMATGYADDIFEYEVTVTNPTLKAPLSDVKLYDDKAKVGTKVLRVNDNTELTWVDDGAGHAMLNLGKLGPESSITFRYRYTALKSDEGEIIDNVALTTGIFKPEREGYSDIPLEAQDNATINILKRPPLTGETNGNGTNLGIGLIIAAMAAFVLRRKLHRQTVED